MPLWIKVCVTIWVAVLLPSYWQETPLNLLWFCNVALLTTTLALWLESSLLVSMQTVAIVYWMLLWVIDFAIHAVAGIKTTPLPLGMSNYMFDPALSLFSRGLSLYHAWLPFVLLWALVRLGYDRRALVAQTLLAWVVLLLSYTLTKDIRGPAGNLNQVYGLSPTEPQHWMAPGVWLMLTMVFCPACLYTPAHFIFCRLFNPPRMAEVSALRVRDVARP